MAKAALPELPLPRIANRATVQARLPEIFPEGPPNRGYCVREMAASTVFVMLYVGAVEGSGRYLSPKQVYRMSDSQAQKIDDAARLSYAGASLNPGFRSRGRPWYADTTREPIRDETLRDGLIPAGAVVARSDLPTTSSKPRCALTESFAALFDPLLTSQVLKSAISAWREENLSAGALARTRLIQAGVVAGAKGIVITFPNGETRRLAHGPSSVISKAVIEVFAPAFLETPGVIWLSESRTKVVERDDELAATLGLEIAPDKNLPDIILVDVGGREPLLVFVETVATDGAITPTRQRALMEIASGAVFRPEHVVFVTAYQDRSSPGFKRAVSGLAWRSFAWFVSEPDHIVILRTGTTQRALLRDLLR